MGPDTHSHASTQFLRMFTIQVVRQIPINQDAVAVLVDEDIILAQIAMQYSCIPSGDVQR